MNPVMTAIRNRRAVRSFETKAVSKEDIKKIVNAGNWAPTGMNHQPWRFIVIKDENFKKKLLHASKPTWQRTVERKIYTASSYARKYLSDLFSRTLRWSGDNYEQLMHRYAEMDDGIYYSAPIIIFVIGSNRGTRNLDCSMVCQNMMLAAYSLGLGSCWVSSGAHVVNNAEIRDALKLKENERIFGPIVLGYPKGGGF